MRLPSVSQHLRRLFRSAEGTRILLAATIVALGSVSPSSAQTYFNLSTGNYSENFTNVAAWGNLTAVGNADSNSFSGVAAATVGTIPVATHTSVATTSFTTSSSSSGVQRSTTSIQLLATGATSNSASVAVDLNLNLSGRTSGNLSFNAATVFNSSGDRQATLRVYYSTNNNTWAELTGTNLPYIATNNVADSQAITATLPATLDNQAQVKLRFYCHNGPAGTIGSRPKISIDDVAVSSSASGLPDTTPPVISTFSPTSGATGVPAEANLVATFNEFVVAGTGNIVIKKISDDRLVATIPVGDPQVTGFGTSSVTINPTSDLLNSTAYYVEIPSGAIKDTAGNPFAGISGNSTWAFTTLVPDVTAPTLVSVSPANGATGVNPTSALTLTFSEPVQGPLLSGPVIRIKNAGGVVATIDPSSFGGGSAVSISGAVVTVTLPSATSLEYGMDYYVELDSGAIEDLASNPFAGFTGNSTWAFTTANVPALTSIPYSQTFLTYLSAATLPSGWSAVGGPAYLSGYAGDWASISDGGFRGNASVYGYHHTSLTQTATPPLQQILTLRNSTGAVITDLTVAYKGRSEIPANTRIPLYTVSVGGTEITALFYSTADGDNAQRQASISGLSIAAGATFQIKWSSAYPAGAGSARQIGISDVSVGVGSSTFSPTVAGLSVPVATTASFAATANANVIASGGPAVTARGFVYAPTSVNSAPQIGGTGVALTTDAAPAVGAYTASLTGLTAATVYTVRGYATNSLGTSYTTSVAFTTLGLPPTLVTSYTQEFDNYLGTNPVGWTAISDSVTPVQSYAGAWGTGSATGGFLGGATAPGVLGYRHTSSSGNLTVTLRLVNGTGSALTALNVSYLGRVKVSATSPEGRSPKWTVAITTGATTTVIPALAYSTVSGVDATVSANLSGLTIAPGAEFSLSWVSDRDASGSGSSKQIGIAQVSVTLPATAGYDSWKAANVGGQGPLLDFDNDGVKNGVEYFFGTTGPSFTPNPQPNAAGKISFPHPAATPGASYKVFTSPDLTNWTDVTTSTVIEPGFVTYTLPSGQGKIFARLQVDIAP
jgi:Bacterial Ig-like domain